MAITNFPDTLINNPETLTGWAAGDTFYDSESGITYTWSPPVWKTDGENGPYVQVGGDNMVGDLTFGTDKITLDAGVGSCNFEGWATFGNGGVNNSKVLVLGSAGAALQVEDNTGTNTVQIQQDGSASFAGTASVAGGSEIRVGDGSAGYVVNDGYGTGIYAGSGMFLQNPAGTITVGMDAAAGSATFAGPVTASNITVRLEADDDTKYTSTTDSEGKVTLVYNGTTLDVKDRLTKADAALQSLKTAVANATDFATLKTAMTAALADI